MIHQLTEKDKEFLLAENTIQLTLLRKQLEKMDEMIELIKTKRHSTYKLTVPLRRLRKAIETGDGRNIRACWTAYSRAKDLSERIRL